MALLPIIGIDIRLVSEERTGDSIVFRELTRALLRERGSFRFRLYTHVTDAAALSELRAVLLCADRSDVELVSLPYSQNRFVWNALTLPLELLRHPIDIYHTQYIAPLFLPSATKLVTHIHDVSFAVHPEWIAPSDRLFLEQLIPRSLERSQLIVAPSRFTQSEIERIYPKTRGRVKVIANATAEAWLGRPVAVEAIQAARERFKLPKRYLIATGTMQPRKNIPFLIRLWRERPAAFQDLGLVLTGNPLGHHVDPEVQAQMEGITFTGYLGTEDLRAVTAGAEVLVFPSLYEGFGLPLLEAFASDVPVVASHIPPFEEVGGDAVTFIDPANLAQAKEALYSLLIDETRKQRLVALGRGRLVLFDWNQSADQLAREYRSLALPAGDPKS